MFERTLKPKICGSLALLFAFQIATCNCGFARQPQESIRVTEETRVNQTNEINDQIENKGSLDSLSIATEKTEVDRTDPESVVREFIRCILENDIRGMAELTGESQLDPLPESYQPGGYYHKTYFEPDAYQREFAEQWTGQIEEMRSENGDRDTLSVKIDEYYHPESNRYIIVNLQKYENTWFVQWMDCYPGDVVEANSTLISKTENLKPRLGQILDEFDFSNERLTVQHLRLFFSKVREFKLYDYIQRMVDAAKDESLQKDIIETLIAGMSSENSERVRVYSSKTLERIGPAAVNYLRPTLKSSDREQRLESFMLLHFSNLPKEEFVSDLIELLNHENLEIQKDAIMALGWLGKDAKKAIPLLKAKLNDENEEIRENAKQTLESIEGV
ncbi:MAG: HEAT repeat domain-containing protein [Pirellulaceae bacterium]